MYMCLKRGGNKNDVVDVVSSNVRNLKINMKVSVK